MSQSQHLMPAGAGTPEDEIRANRAACGLFTCQLPYCMANGLARLPGEGRP
jgi:hypothetical protein